MYLNKFIQGCTLFFLVTLSCLISCAYAQDEAAKKKLAYGFSDFFSNLPDLRMSFYYKFSRIEEQLEDVSKWRCEYLKAGKRFVFRRYKIDKFGKDNLDLIVAYDGIVYQAFTARDSLLRVSTEADHLKDHVYGVFRMNPLYRPIFLLFEDETFNYLEISDPKYWERVFGEAILSESEQGNRAIRFALNESDLNLRWSGLDIFPNQIDGKKGDVVAFSFKSENRIALTEKISIPNLMTAVYTFNLPEKHFQHEEVVTLIPGKFAILGQPPEEGLFRVPKHLVKEVLDMNLDVRTNVQGK